MRKELPNRREFLKTGSIILARLFTPVFEVSNLPRLPLKDPEEPESLNQVVDEEQKTLFFFQLPDIDKEWYESATAFNQERLAKVIKLLVSTGEKEVISLIEDFHEANRLSVSKNDLPRWERLYLVTSQPMTKDYVIPVPFAFHPWYRPDGIIPTLYVRKDYLEKYEPDSIGQPILFLYMLGWWRQELEMIRGFVNNNAAFESSELEKLSLGNLEIFASRSMAKAFSYYEHFLKAGFQDRQFDNEFGKRYKEWKQISERPDYEAKWLVYTNKWLGFR